ncbi:MAG: helix-turn-helix domain-containing protein [Defluviitaleaceae bacterium]|nr:helix-turn-helix domain-containing protein [Defluviitaleaceae bacterium]
MNRVKELREKKGLKQTDLAAMLEISQGTLSNWERGVHDPDNETLLRLAQIFECSVDYLLGSTELRKPQLGELDGLFMRVMQDAQESGITPHDLQLAVNFLKQAKERNDNIGNNPL